ncbi:MAG: hypothetical protein ACOCZ5_01510 [bacterium]
MKKVVTSTEFLDKYKKMSKGKKDAFKQVLDNCQENLKAPVWKKKMFKR